MKRTILLSAISFILLGLSSCNEEGDSGLGNYSTTFASGVKTTTTNDYTNWTGVPNIHFHTAYPVNYSNWTLEIGDSHGYFKENIAGVDTHWRGRISYTEKDKWCNDKTYADSLQLDITNNESGWNELVYRTTSYTSNNGGAFIQTSNQNIYNLKTDSAGNINSISVYDANNAYIFKFKTTVKDDFNSWKTVDMQDGWMNDQAKTSLLLMPVLFTIFQQ